MNKRYVLNIDEYYQMAAEELRTYLGVATNFCNHLPIIESIVYNYFYGPPLNGIGDSVSIIKGYGVPTEAAIEIVDKIKDRLFKQLSNTVGPLKSNAAYDCAFTPMGDVIIVEMNKDPTPEEQVLKSITEGLERGDYYPERIRKLFGV